MIRSAPIVVEKWTYSPLDFETIVTPIIEFFPSILRDKVTRKATGITYQWAFFLKAMPEYVVFRYIASDTMIVDNFESWLLRDIKFATEKSYAKFAQEYEKRAANEDFDFTFPPYQSKDEKLKALLAEIQKPI